MEFSYDDIPTDFYFLAYMLLGGKDVENMEDIIEQNFKFMEITFQCLWF